jgi:hypothetical protein
LEEQFEVGGSCFGGCWSDAERCFLKCFDNLLRLHPSDAVLFDKLLNRGGGKRLVLLVIEKELEKLAEKGVERLVFWGEGDEMRPAS